MNKPKPKDRQPQPRKGTRKNPDGSESTHLMEWGSTDNGYTAYPTLFQEANSSWTELNSDDAYNRSKESGEAEFFDKKRHAKKWAEGSWKKHQQGFKYGGNMNNTYNTGGLINFNGPSHEQGGIQMPFGEVEGGEAMDKDFIFTDSVSPAGSKETYASLAKKIEAKYTKRMDDKISKESKDRDIENLKVRHESDPNVLKLRAKEELKQRKLQEKEFAAGGFMRDLGNTLVNSIAAPAESLIGKNFYNPKFQGRAFEQVNAGIEQSAGYATQIAANYFLPGIGGAAIAGLQGGVDAIDKNNKLDGMLVDGGTMSAKYGGQVNKRYIAGGPGDPPKYDYGDNQPLIMDYPQNFNYSLNDMAILPPYSQEFHPPVNNQVPLANYQPPVTDTPRPTNAPIQGSAADIIKRAIMAKMPTITDQNLPNIPSVTNTPIARPSTGNVYGFGPGRRPTVKASQYTTPLAPGSQQINADGNSANTRPYGQVGSLNDKQGLDVKDDQGLDVKDDQGFNTKINPLGAALNSIGPLAQLIGTASRGVDPVNFERVTLPTVDYSEAINNTNRQANIARGNNRNAIRNYSQGTGQLLAGQSAAEQGVFSKTADTNNNIIMSQNNQNAQIKGQQNLVNNQTANNENIAREQQRAAYRDAIYGSMTDLGNIGAGYLKDVNMAGAQDVNNTRTLNMLNSLGLRYMMNTDGSIVINNK